MHELEIDGRYTVKGVQSELGISESTVWRWVKDGELTPVYYRARVLFEEKEVDELAKRREAGWTWRK